MGNRDGVAERDQLANDVRTDELGSAEDQNAHGPTSAELGWNESTPAAQAPDWR
jgi:hypothetical protein